MVAQIIISIAAGCFCCRLGSYQSNSDRTWAVILFVMSWVAFVDISFKLLFGAAPNGHHGNKTVYFGTHPCYFVKSGVFGYAAALSFVAMFYEIAYLDLESKKIRNEAGIAKVHPQGPPPPQQHLPVVGFVGAFFRLLSGAAHHGNGTMYSGTHPCYFVKSGAFGHAALLSFYAAAGGFAYLGLELVKISNEAGMAKVHPQGPTPPPQHPPA